MTQKIAADAESLEARSLELLTRMQAEMHSALVGLAGGRCDGLYDGYLVYTAGHVNRAAEGYIYLRKSGRLDASKHLIRTAIEAVIRLQAVQKKPELLFRIAFTEFNDDKKWVRSTKPDDAVTAVRIFDENWKKFKQRYRAKYPNHTLLEQEISLRATAEEAKIEPYYDTHYRLYCRFTHGAFRATTGNLNVFDPEDNRTMALCALSAIEALSSVGASTPNMQQLREQLAGLDKGTSMNRTSYSEV